MATSERKCTKSPVHHRSVSPRSSLTDKAAFQAAGGRDVREIANAISRTNSSVFFGILHPTQTKTNPGERKKTMEKSEMCRFSEWAKSLLALVACLTACGAAAKDLTWTRSCQTARCAWTTTSLCRTPWWWRRAGSSPAGQHARRRVRSGDDGHLSVIGRDKVARAPLSHPKGTETMMRIGFERVI